MVDSHHFTLSRKDIKRFYWTPLWLIVRLWQHCKEKEIERMNLDSIATAKQTYLIENALISLGGGKNTTTSLDKYLPFFDHKSKKVKIDQLTADCFWELMDSNIPEHIFQSFNEPELMDLLRALKRQE